MGARNLLRLPTFFDPLPPILSEQGSRQTEGLHLFPAGAHVFDKQVGDAETMELHVAPQIGENLGHSRSETAGKGMVFHRGQP